MVLFRAVIAIPLPRHVWNKLNCNLGPLIWSVVAPLDRQPLVQRYERHPNEYTKATLYTGWTIGNAAEQMIVLSLSGPL